MRLLMDKFNQIGDINSRNLKLMRNEKKLRQREVAARMYMSLSGYKRWESKKCFDSEDIFRIALAFELSPSDVFLKLNSGLL